MIGDIPVWLAALVSGLAVFGALLTLLGCVGLLRFETFYRRIHAPTLGTSFGAIGVLLSSAVYFSATSHRFLIHEILIFLFISVTTPITLTLLARAALYRDRVEENDPTR
mgnify:FL=1